MKPIKLKYAFFLLFSIIFLQSCEFLKESSLSNIYHNVTSRYNIYFNANEIAKEIITDLEESHVDNYNTILDIYRFGDEKSLKSNASSSDQIIKKCTKIFDKHKDSRWVDDSYLLVAKAYFLKGDFYAAIETFQYVSNKYKGTVVAYEAALWLVYCNLMLEKVEDAQARVTFIKSDKEFPPSLLKDLELSDAYVSILLEDYISAIKSLKKAIPREQDRIHKTRYMFILGQLYEQTGDKKAAQDIYSSVIKRNPPYEMAFNAKIEIARSYDIKDEKDAREIKTLLSKMLKDDKNLQYLDQIYFEMALIDLKAGNSAEAEKNLKLCIDNSKNNQNQKAIAYLKLAEYYYEKPDYKLAKLYFDSTALSLGDDYPGYEELTAKNKVLGLLVENFVTIETEDSLVYLATIGTKSRDSIIDLAYKEDLKQEQLAQQAAREKKVREEQDMRINRNQLKNRTIMPPGMPNLKNGGQWYFYNQNSMKIGEAEFKVRWGNRKLEDDWRRKHKTGSGEIAEVEESDSSGVKTEEVVFELTETEKNFIKEQLKNIPQPKQKYYFDIPLTESQKKTSYNKVMLALKENGEIYSEQLMDTLSAIATFEDLLKRFPRGKYNPLAHYLLYKFYTDLDENTKAQLHKDTILANYPKSDYAILIKDPNYYKNLAETQNKVIDSTYSIAYDYYQSGDCGKLLALVTQINKKYPDNYKNEHLAYLALLCKGKNQDVTTLATSLETFTASATNTKLIAHAQLLLDYLNNESETDSAAGNVEEMDTFLANSPYVLDEISEHNFVYVFETRKVNTNDLKTAFSDYNAEYHSLEEYTTSTFILDKTYQVLVVQSFDNKLKAAKYLKGVRTDEDFLVKIKNRKPIVFIISKENFATLLKEGDFKSYKEFYKRYY